MAKKVPARKVPTPAALTEAERSFVKQPAPAPSEPRSKAPQKAKGLSTKEPSSPAPRRATVERADGRTLRRIQLYFEMDVAKSLMHHCVEHELDMSKFVNEIVRKTLGA